MRNINPTVADRVAKKAQTIADNANPQAYARIMRHTIPIGEKQYIERTIIKRTANITDSDVAVCHPRFLRDDSDIWAAYVSNGTLHIRHTKNVEVLTDAVWADYYFTAPASACSIAFDSKARHNPQGIWEFVTDEVPWVFWVDDGALKAKLCTPLGEYIHDLAQANVTDVSAVRGPSGDYGSWNLGLTVFFVMAGSLYYRQYIDGEWCDAELVQFAGLSDITISKIKAFNTWDYRVGVQILANDGKLYELYSYTEGIGTRGTEHLSVGVEAVGTLTGLTYRHEFFREHLSVSASAVGTLLWGWSTIPLSAENTSSTVIEITMDYPNTAGQASEFYLEDSNGVIYVCSDVECEGNVVRLTFEDFSRAADADDVTVHYTQGTLMSPAVLTDSFTITFEPTGLVSPVSPAPEFLGALNDPEGDTINVVLTQELTNTSPSGTDGCFGLSLHEYTYVPGGTLEDTERDIASVGYGTYTKISLIGATYSDTVAEDGKIRLEME